MSTSLKLLCILSLITICICEVKNVVIEDETEWEVITGDSQGQTTTTTTSSGISDEVKNEMKDYHETLKNPAFRDINSKPEVQESVLQVAKANYKTVCGLEENWAWDQLTYTGSGITKGVKYYLEVDMRNSLTSKLKRYQLLVWVRSYDSESQKYEILFEECVISPIAKYLKEDL